MKNFFKSLSIVLVFFVVSFELVQMRYQKEALLVRDPASVGYDLTSHSGERLTEEIKKAILSDLTVVTQSPWVYLSIGHFRFIDSDGRPKWGCESFDRVAFNFVADSAVNGELTEMIVEAKCFYHNGSRTIEPIKLPLKEIFEEYEPNDGEINFNYEVPVTINFKNLPGGFSKKWYLEKIKLIKPSGDVFEVNNADISLYKKNITLSL